MSFEQEEQRKRINAEIAAENSQIHHVVEGVYVPAVRYFEVCWDTTTTEIEFHGNNARLEVGELFKCIHVYPSAIGDVSSWLVPIQFNDVALKSIASELCQELDEETYLAKLNAKQNLPDA